MARKPQTCTRVTQLAAKRQDVVLCGAPAVGTLVPALQTPRDPGHRCLAHLPPLETPQYRAERALHLAEAMASTRRTAYQRQVENIHEDLLRLARDAEQLVHARPEQYSSGYLSIAHGIQHAALWAVPNLGLDYLTERAAELQQAERELASARAVLAALDAAPTRSPDDMA